MPDILPPDDLSGWTLPPPAARTRGEVAPALARVGPDMKQETQGPQPTPPPGTPREAPPDPSLPPPMTEPPPPIPVPRREQPGGPQPIDDPPAAPGA